MLRPLKDLLTLCKPGLGCCCIRQPALQELVHSHSILMRHHRAMLLCSQEGRSSKWLGCNGLPLQLLKMLGLLPDCHGVKSVH